MADLVVLRVGHPQLHAVGLLRGDARGQVRLGAGARGPQHLGLVVGARKPATLLVVGGRTRVVAGAAVEDDDVLGGRLAGVGQDVVVLESQLRGTGRAACGGGGEGEPLGVGERGRVFDRHREDPVEPGRALDQDVVAGGEPVGGGGDNAHASSHEEARRVVGGRAGDRGRRRAGDRGHLADVAVGAPALLVDVVAAAARDRVPGDGVEVAGQGQVVGSGGAGAHQRLGHPVGGHRGDTVVLAGQVGGDRHGGCDDHVQGHVAGGSEGDVGQGPVGGAQSGELARRVGRVGDRDDVRALCEVQVEQVRGGVGAHQRVGACSGRPARRGGHRPEVGGGERGHTSDRDLVPA